MQLLSAPWARGRQLLHTGNRGEAGALLQSPAVGKAAIYCPNPSHHTPSSRCYLPTARDTPRHLCHSLPPISPNMAPRSMRILSANIRGFRTNVGELTNAVLRNRADIVVAVETFLNDTCVTTCDRIPGFSHWARRDRANRQGGGVAVCHREGLQLQQLSVAAPEELEIMFFRLLLHDKTAVLFCPLYRPQWQHSAPLTFLTDQLDTIMSTHSCQHVIIAGDMNQHLVSRAYTELLAVHGLTNHVTFATHEHGASLDPVLTDLPGDSVQCCPLDKVGSSDHFAVLCELGLNPCCEEGGQRTIWLWEKANWQSIKNVLESTDWDAIFTTDVNENVTALTSTILSAQAIHVPHRTYRAEPRDQPWFGYRCRQAAEKKYRAWTRLKRRPTRRHKAQHRAACKAMTRVAAWARGRWESDQRRKLATNQMEPKHWWSLIKQRQGTVTQERIPPLKTAAGELVTANQDKAELLAAHFSNKMTTEEPEREPPHLPRLCDRTLDNVVVSENVVTRHLRSVNTRKSPGPDEISPFILKNCAEELTKPVTHIFQQCLHTSTWPTAWKEARVTPVHKKRDKSDPGNYRPISLLSTLSKILERIIAEQLTCHLEEHHLLSPRQYGFRKGRSASDLLLLLSQTWQDALDSGRPSLVVALDIAGAFDRVWHKGLLAKIEQLGIAGQLLELFSSYLLGRSLRVVVSGCTSATHPIEASVPQGSILGPLLWNIYFNDLLQSLPVVSAYADDCSLSLSYNREEAVNVIDATNRQLGEIMAWGRRWQVKFAAEKTQALLISRSREDARLLEGQLKFGDDTLAIEDSINILGIEVDSKLSFDRHLECVARRASLRVTLLRRVSHLLDADGLMKLYKAQVRPVMEYCPLAWMSSAKCHLSLLDKVQRRAERLINGAGRREQQPQQQSLHPGRQQRQQQQQLQPCLLDSLEHRRRVGALTVLHKAQIRQTPHLAALRVPWRRSERTTRAVVSDVLLEVPRTRSVRCQRAFTYATSVLWNTFTAAVDVTRMSSQQVKCAANVWLRLHPP